MERTATPDIEKKAFIDTSYATLVLIDFHDTAHLKLKLPERDVLIKDEGLELIWKTANFLYYKRISRTDLVNGLSADHPLRSVSPYPILRPSWSVSNLVGVRWILKDGGLVPAEGDRLERREIVSINLDGHSVQDSCYFESMIESIAGMNRRPVVVWGMFEETENEHALGKGVIPYFKSRAMPL